MYQSAQLVAATSTSGFHSSSSIPERKLAQKQVSFSKAHEAEADKLRRRKAEQDEQSRQARDDRVKRRRVEEHGPQTSPAALSVGRADKVRMKLKLTAVMCAAWR